MTFPTSLPLGEPAAEQPTTTPAPEAPTTPPAESGTSDATQFEAPFNINDVPAEQRPYVEAYQKQLQGAWTRKTQELAQQRAELQEQYAPAQTLYARLHAEDEAERDAAIKEVLTANGWDVGGDEHEALVEELAPAPVADETVQQLQARLEAAEAKLNGYDERDQQAAHQEYVQDVKTRYETAVGDWAKRNGYTTEQGEVNLPEHVQTQILGFIRGVAPIEENGRQYPDLTSALSLMDAAHAAYLTSKDVPAPTASAVTAQPGFNSRSDAERMAKMHEIAGRHL